MKTKIPVKLFLEDLYTNGLEPAIGETVYGVNNQIMSESHTTMFGTHTTSHITGKVEVRGRYYGNPTTMKSVGKREIAKEPKSNYYNRLFLCKKGDTHGIWIYGCFILRNVEIL